MEIVRRQAEMCSALGDYHRVLLLYAMAETPRSVSELATIVQMAQPAVSHHLRIMRERGVVRFERRGKSVYYSPADPRIIEALDLLRAVQSDIMQQQGVLAQLAASRPQLSED